MWNHSTLEMDINKGLISKFKKYAKISGIIFILIGLAGILFPTVLTFVTTIFVAYLMLIAGISSAWFTWVSNRNDWAGWLKSIVLIGVASYIFIDPLQGVATLGLVLSFYFFMDAFAGFGLALSLRPEKIWMLWLFNAFTSLVLGVLFVVGWPMSSLYLIGILVGISLLFDGITLLAGGAFLDKLENE